MPSKLAEVNNEATNSIDDKVSRIREVLVDDYHTNNQLYDECDIQTVRQNDWPITRFLMANKNSEQLALKNLTEALQWRKKFGVNTITDDYFPEEFYKIGGIFEYQTDKNGCPLLYFRVCCHHKVPELAELIRKFFVHQVNKMDASNSGDQHWAILFDCSNSGISNVDMDFARFMIHVLQHYYAKGFKYVLIYNLPWIMMAFFKISRAWLSAEVNQMIRFANGPQIFDFIDAENVPEYIPDGKCTKSIHTTPDGVKQAEELPHIEFTKEEIQRFRNIFGIKDNEENGNTENKDNEELD